MQQMLEQERPQDCHVPQGPGHGHVHLEGQGEGIRRQPPNCHLCLDEARDLTTLTTRVKAFLNPGPQLVTGLGPLLPHLVLCRHCPILFQQAVVDLVSHQSGKERHTGHLPGRGLCTVECLEGKTKHNESENSLIPHPDSLARGKHQET